MTICEDRDSRALNVEVLIMTTVDVKFSVFACLRDHISDH